MQAALPAVDHRRIHEVLCARRTPQTVPDSPQGHVPHHRPRHGQVTRGRQQRCHPRGQHRAGGAGWTHRSTGGGHNHTSMVRYNTVILNLQANI